MRKLYCFDFDGTLTSKDSMLEFIRYACGTPALVWAMLRVLPLLVLMKLHLFSNERTKEMVLGYCFRGWTMADFTRKAETFAREYRHILRREMLQIMSDALADGAEVMVVSASVVTWVRPFFADMPRVKVVGTMLEVTDGRLTGRLACHNCYGQEKVNRILKEYPALKESTENRKEYYIYAYGDSRGDREMLSFANEGVKV